MRHYLTSIAFALKLLHIGFVYLISVSIHAAQEARQESVAELMAKLFSDNEEIWRPAVQAVARREDTVVLTLAEEARREPGRSYRVGLVFENFTSAAAKKELIALLEDRDEQICGIAALALMKHGDSSAAPALTKAMKRVQDAHIRWNIARALWKVGANDQSAKAILSVARTHKGQSKDALFMIVDNPIGRRHMTEEERLNFLLNYKLGMIVGYPEALEISLNPREEFERELLSDNDDRLFLEKHRAQVVDMMLVRLRDRGSTVAALLLGYFKEPKALPDLQKWFIESDSFYGWEGNWNALCYSQFPNHHCYEEAIKHITGKPIHEVIKLTDEQVTQLVQGYRKERAWGRASKLYVLFRLKSHIALEEATRKFRNLTKEERFRFCHLMEDLLPRDLSVTEVRRLLGEPDKVRESTWFYDCGNSPIDVPYVLTITFDNDRVIKIDADRH
ncbi:MAG: hypothetical protein OXT74_07340 [Candidatus Poribacteria bacterium]|nr:hypothetical protein [Candidatus Poribacteria bacterium]